MTTSGPVCAECGRDDALDSWLLHATSERTRLIAVLRRVVGANVLRRDEPSDALLYEAINVLLARCDQTDRRA